MYARKKNTSQSRVYMCQKPFDGTFNEILPSLISYLEANVDKSAQNQIKTASNPLDTLSLGISFIFAEC